MSEEILDKEQSQEVSNLFQEEFGEEAKKELEQKEQSGVSSFLKKNPDMEMSQFDDLGLAKEGLNFSKIIKLAEETEHLPGFKLMDNDLGLTGEQYIAPKKFLYYYENSLQQETQSYKVNHKTKFDNRPHGLIITPPGAGKTTIKNQIKRTLKDFNETDSYIEVSGISHPEQLVGKIKYEGSGKNKTPVTKYGILGYKCVMNDEAQGLLNEENEVYAKSQKLKRGGMDTYGENEVSKKLVDDSPKDALWYYSTSRVLDFAHPVRLTSAFFDTGSFRRYYAFNIQENNEVDLEDVTGFEFAPKEKQEKTWKEFLDEKYTNDINVEFNQDTANIIQHYHKCLLYFLLNHKNRNVLRYGLLTKYALRGMFCKNVLTLSKTKKEETPTIQTTIEACYDTLLFVLKSIETYNNLGDMGSTSDVWGGVSEEDAQALEYLYRYKMFDWDSSQISIQQFWEMLGHLHGLKTTQSRKKYYDLKKNGYIKSQKGQYETRVWLSYIPKEIQVKNKDFQPLKFWDTYLSQSVGASNPVLTLCKRLFSDDKKFQKAQSDGSVGVMGCVLIYYYIRVQAQDKNKNKNNIYDLINKRIGSFSDTSVTLTQIPQNKANKSPNRQFQSVTPPKNAPTLCQETQGNTPKKKKDKDVQFWEHPECKHIKPNCSKNDTLNYIKQNPGVDYKVLYEKLGIGSLKFKNELLKEGKIKQTKSGFEVV